MWPLNLCWFCVCVYVCMYVLSAGGKFTACAKAKKLLTLIVSLKRCGVAQRVREEVGHVCVSLCVSAWSWCGERDDGLLYNILERWLSFKTKLRKWNFRRHLHVRNRSKCTLNARISWFAECSMNRETPNQAAPPTPCLFNAYKRTICYSMWGHVKWLLNWGSSKSKRT